MQKGEMYGVVADGLRFDFAKLVERRKKVVDMLHRGLANSLKALGVQVFHGNGVLADVNGGTASVSIVSQDGERMLSSKFVLLASGSSPRVPDGVKIGGRIMTNREVFSLEQQPGSLLITGGGTVGCEMASFFSSIGTRVTVVERGERLIMREDCEISAEFLKLLTRSDAKVDFGTSVLSLEDRGGSVHVVLERDGVREEIDVECALVAAGRSLNNDVCDYRACGISVADGKVVTNGCMQTSVPNVYAIGDLAGKMLLAYTAEREGEIAAYHILGVKMDDDACRMNYGSVPSVIFTHPEIASVGLTEEAARAAGKNIIVKKAMFAMNSKALIMGERDGFVKVVCEAGSGALLGVHIIGPDATTIIDKATLAVSRGLDASIVLSAIAGHPVTSETLEAALEMVVEEGNRGEYLS
jgi:dihydrolipoamide dehydrogenase